MKIAIFFLVFVAFAMMTVGIGITTTQTAYANHDEGQWVGKRAIPNDNAWLLTGDQGLTDHGCLEDNPGRSDRGKGDDRSDGECNREGLSE
jgi:hypothetical protein